MIYWEPTSLSAPIAKLGQFVRLARLGSGSTRPGFSTFAVCHGDDENVLRIERDSVGDGTGVTVIKSALRGI